MIQPILICNLLFLVMTNKFRVNKEQTKYRNWDQFSKSHSCSEMHIIIGALGRLIFDKLSQNVTYSINSKAYTTGLGFEHLHCTIF